MPIKGDLGTEYTFNLLKKFNLEDKDFKVLYDHAKKRNVLFLCTPGTNSAPIK